MFTELPNNTIALNLINEVDLNDETMDKQRNYFVQDGLNVLGILEVVGYQTISEDMYDGYSVTFQPTSEVFIPLV